MSFRKIVGHALLWLPLAFLVSLLELRSSVVEAFEAARDAVLLTVSGEKTGDAGGFEVTYPHAHGAEVENAEGVEEKDAGKADLELRSPTHRLLFRYGQGFRASTGSGLGAGNRVEVIRSFPGDVKFRNQVCGCELLGMNISLLLGTPVALGLAAIGVYLVRSRPAAG